MKRIVGEIIRRCIQTRGSAIFSSTLYPLLDLLYGAIGSPILVKPEPQDPAFSLGPVPQIAHDDLLYTVL